jgi:hypothetical protein
VSGDPDAEAGELPTRRVPVDGHAYHARQPRPALEIENDGVDRFPLSFEDDADAPIPQVHRVSNQPTPFRAPARELPVPNTLHSSLDQNLRPLLPVHIAPLAFTHSMQLKTFTRKRPRAAH